MVSRVVASGPDCVLCGGKNTRHYWHNVWLDEKAEVFFCPDCDLLFLWPCMNEKDESAYYEQYDEHILKREVVKHREAPEEEILRSERMFVYRFELFQNRFRSHKRVMEIGGGYGNFLGWFVEQGIAVDPVLVEKNPARLSYAASRYKIQGCEEIGLVDKKDFDLIMMFHVLEHISDPSAFIRKCRQMLKEEGEILVEVPCGKDPLLTMYDCDAFKNYYFQPMHPLIYSETALRVLFEKNGFLAEEFIHVQRYGLANHLQWLSKGKPGGNDDYSRLLGDTCEKVYRERLIESGTTDTILAVFKKSKDVAS